MNSGFVFPHLNTIHTPSFIVGIPPVAIGVYTEQTRLADE